MRKTLLILLLVFFTFGQVEAVSVRPAVIEETGSARDSFHSNVSLRNSSGFRVRIYPLIYEITADGRQLFSTDMDRTDHLARWIEFTRSRTELEDGSVATMPLSVRIDRNAQRGSYYAAVVFARGSTESEAIENAESERFPEILISVEVEERVVESAQLIHFAVNRGGEISFPVELESIGNAEVVPTGSIIIYEDRSGREIASVPINEEEKTIEAGEMAFFENGWDPGDNFGKYRARLVLEYGSEGKRDIQDTVHFWLIPWRLVGIAFLGLLFLAVLLWLFFREKKKVEEVFISSKS